MYVSPNYLTKRALREAITQGRTVSVFQPGGIFPGTRDGETSIEGPHYPAAHSWYARVRVKDGIVVKVLS